MAGSVAPIHDFGSRALTRLRPGPRPALIPPPPACRGRFRSRHYNFDWRSLHTRCVKLILLICSGVFLLQTLADILLEEFVAKEFVNRRDVLSLICEAL